jgi:N-acetylglutamate synthase-like GNAT family acetyltransferase
MSRFQVRRARAEDRDRLAQIYRDASLSNAGDRAAVQAHPRALILDEDLIARGHTRVATLADGEVVGFAGAYPTASEALEVDDLFVDPPWQRHGVGLVLLDALIREAQRDGIRRLEVTTNDHAMAFYRAAGFSTVGRVQTTFGAGSRMQLTIGETQV